ncbi:uncharacterized protein PAC_03160 [Phialocephala subalpina]|uniref:Uncharacterized protein n=1 Tax=Phialocephala subalpina TaxID=576137 RepID=A0A1L7WKH4_9HELO|nr:uncharacterized protein PAC_03160 [Phialocephala subalpina]
MEQTTARLRKTFHYPTDNDEEDDLPEALDEEEQEQVIHTLHQQNTQTNNTYRLALLSLPLLSLVPYLPSLFVARTSFLALLSVTSLLSTAFLLYALPPEETGIAILDRLNAPPSKKGRNEGGRLDILGGDDGPVKKYLPYLNLGLCVVLALLGALVGRKTEMWTGFGWLPAGVYGVAVLAKWVMGSVDPEGELGELKYGFKGA